MLLHLDTAPHADISLVTPGQRPLQVSIFRYDDEEWEHLLKHDGSGWSKEESDYLLDLCEQYQLRFIVMADRYEFAGSSR
jgi:hypothetical protein